VLDVEHREMTLNKNHYSETVRLNQTAYVQKTFIILQRVNCE